MTEMTLLGCEKGFNPLSSAEYGALWAWFDFSDATTMYRDAGSTLVSANAQAVQRVVCKVGSGALVSRVDQTTAGNQATYRTNVQNGLSVLRFDGTDDKYTLTYSAELDDTLTMYFVGNVTNTAAIKYIFGGVTEAAAFRFDASEKLALMEENIAQILLATSATTAGAVTLTTVTYSAGNSAIFDGTSANGTGSHYAPSTMLSSPSLLGSTGSTLYYAGDMCEILVYKALHSATAKKYVWNYLLTKWAI